ncbi:MAG: phosphatase PAP2 family protein [Candidatus Saccharicenans sp.]
MKFPPTRNLKAGFIPGRFLSVILFFLLIEIALFSNPLSIQAQAKTDQNSKENLPQHLNVYFLKHLIKNTKDTILSPAHWDKDDWLSAAIATASTLAFLPVDNSIHHWAEDESSSAGHSVAKVFSGAGSPAMLLGLISTGYIYGEIFKQTNTRETFLLAGESLLIAEIFVQVGKMGIGRARPYTGEGAFSFHPFTTQGKWQSFPSGHATAAWALASCLAARTDSNLLRISIYSLATGISLSRIILDKHFASDVLAGSILGFFIGKKIGQPLKKLKNKPELNFIAGRGIIAFSLNYSY